MSADKRKVALEAAAASRQQGVVADYLSGGRALANLPDAELSDFYVQAMKDMVANLQHPAAGRGLGAAIAEYAMRGANPPEHLVAEEVAAVIARLHSIPKDEVELMGDAALARHHEAKKAAN